MPAPIAEWLERFDERPGEVGRLFRHLFERHPDEFENAMPECLLPFRGTPGQLYLLGILSSHDRILPFIDRLPSSVTGLGPLLDSVSRLDPGFYYHLLRELEKGDRPQGPRSARWLQLLESSRSLQSLLPALTRLSADTDGHLSSKAALLAGRLTHSTDWFHTRLQHPDPRVRANAVEGLWNSGHPAANEIFILASRDPHQRVAANGWIGLYLAGRPESLAGLRTMAAHEDPALRRSAVWAMGKLADPRLALDLKDLLNDPGPGIARQALLSLRRITQTQTERQTRPNAELALLRSEINGPFWDIEFTSASSTPPNPLTLRPLDWMVEHGGVFSSVPPVEVNVPSGAAHILFLLPQTLALPLPQLLAKKRAVDHWSTLRYAPSRKSRLVDWQGQVLHASGGGPGAERAEDIAPPPRLFFHRDPRHIEAAWQAGADPSKPAPDFGLALRHGLLSLWRCPSPRALIAILPTAPQASLHALSSIAAETAVTIHAAGADSLPDEWKNHFDALGFTAWGPGEDLAPQVSRVLSAFNWNARVTLPAPASAGPVNLILTTPGGYGELRLGDPLADCLD